MKNRGNLKNRDSKEGKKKNQQSEPANPQLKNETERNTGWERKTRERERDWVVWGNTNGYNSG